MMVDLFIKGGFLMYPIALCSILGVTIFIYKFMEYRRIIKNIEKPLMDVLNEKPQILVPILSAIENGASEKQLSVIGTKCINKIEKGLSWLGLISTIAPLLGLTGTVTGMIKAFMVIANATSVNPSMLAGGIWEALITTAAGLFVAVPIHIGHHYLEKQADKIAFILKEITVAVFEGQKNGI
jgi:biopolymer transport protein ExbB